ncbi:MAG TPA: SMP-30/gluconolactonase/LRE family protein, partial [Alphaproteobacteria bacterium]|nr:SMP-30/gluconolactonase/LRE family protein [Alphaproteobacteria bacterium]
VAHGRIFQVSPAGEFTVVADYDGQPNGLKIHRDGRIFIADFANGIMELDPVSGRVGAYLARERFPDFKGFNDLFFATNGDLYFTDQGLTGQHDPSGRLWRYTADGHFDCLLDAVPSPNGLVMAPDESQLYLAVTRGNCVWRVPFLLDGNVAKVGIFVQLSGAVGPDGLAVNAAGDLFIAHVGGGSVWQFSPLGEPLARIRSCAGLLTTNMAFGGEGNRTLYITESETGTVLAADLETPGQPMFSHAGG